MGPDILVLFEETTDDSYPTICRAAFCAFEILKLTREHLNNILTQNSIQIYLKIYLIYGNFEGIILGNWNFVVENQVKRELQVIHQIQSQKSCVFCSKLALEVISSFCKGYPTSFSNIYQIHELSPDFPSLKNDPLPFRFKLTYETVVAEFLPRLVQEKIYELKTARSHMELHMACVVRVLLLGKITCTFSFFSITKFK